MTQEQLVEAAKQMRHVCEQEWCFACPFFIEEQDQGNRCGLLHTNGAWDWRIRGDEE